jgi:hypothetical protein
VKKGGMGMWEDIKGYEGLYQINEDGKVKSLARVKGFILCKERILKEHKNNNGYIRVTLSKNDEAKKFFIHRLVYETFIGQIPKEYEINHMDKNRLNNNITNLELVTNAENSRMKTNTKLTIGKVRAIRLSNKSNKELAQIYNISPRTVMHVKNKTRWKDI